MRIENDFRQNAQKREDLDPLPVKSKAKLGLVFAAILSMFVRIRLMQPKLPNIALRTTVLYVVIGGLWILLSDRAVRSLDGNEDLFMKLSTYKGWFFVVATGALLYVTLRTQLQRWGSEFTARKHAEAELKASQSRVQLLLESTHDILFMLDLEGRYVKYIGPSEFSTAESAIVGKHPAEVYEKRIAETITERHNKVLATGEQIIEDDLFVISGKKVWFSTKVSPVRDPVGRCIGSVSIAHNITPRKRVEEVLRLSEERFRRVMDHIPEVVVIYDHNLRFQYVNKTLEQWSGLSAAEIIGRTDDEVWNPDIAAAYSSLLREVLRSAEPRSGERVIRASTGKDLTLQLTYIPLLTETGEVREILGFAHNLTDRIIAEEAIRSSERRFRSYVEHAPLGVMVSDSKGRILEANPTSAQIFGYDRDELIGMNIISLVPAEDKKEAAHYFARFLSNGEFEGELRGRRKDGEIIWTFLVGVSLADNRQLGYCVDITQRKRAEEQVKASLGEKEVLLREIHHRVKNNLQVISSLLSLQAHQVGDVQAKGAFEDSQHRVRSMALIHENLYRSENLASIRFDEYIRVVSSELWRSFNTSRVRKVIRTEPITLELDKALPCGLILNELVTNALKHGFPGERGGNVAISLEAVNQSNLRLEVHDDGVGFPPERDFRSMTSMGMTLILSLADQVGGKIVMERNHGTKMVLEFPA